jgi:hypothetical protein
MNCHSMTLELLRAGGVQGRSTRRRRAPMRSTSLSKKRYAHELPLHRRQAAGVLRGSQALCVDPATLNRGQSWYPSRTALRQGFRVATGLGRQTGHDAEPATARVGARSLGAQPGGRVCDDRTPAQDRSRATVGFSNRCAPPPRAVATDP